MGEALGELKEDLRRIDQRLASLELDARKPRLAMEVDVKVDKKTRECTEGATTAVQAKHGDGWSAKRVQVGPTSSTRFGVKAKSLALPCRDDFLVENGAVAPKSCLSPLEMRTSKAAGGLLPTGKTFTAIMAMLHQLPLWFCSTENIHFMTSIQCASYYSSFWWINNQLSPSGRSMEQNQGKIWCSIPGGRQVVSAPVRFWERGARCFVGSFLLGRWMRLQRFLAEG